MSDPPPLRRAVAVVRDRRHVRDGRDLETGRLERADRLLAAGARPTHEDLDLAHAMLHRATRGAIGAERGGIRGALARPLEARHPGAAQGERVRAFWPY